MLWAPGRNRVIDAFPTGSRLAFDPAKGRLWVICPTCTRWNLVPLEERWEAVQTCERYFRGAPRRIATNNIGLVKLPEGLELVRIGAPARSEFAAWRYGRTFARRHRRLLAVAGLGVAGGTALLLPTLSPQLLAILPAVYLTVTQSRRYKERLVARLPAKDGAVLTVQRRHVGSAQIETGSRNGGWMLHVAHREGEHHFLGDDAIRPLGHLLAFVNGAGGNRGQVLDAVRAIEEEDNPVSYLETIAARHEGSTRLEDISPVDRLALEMATQEEVERRAMEENLAGLEQEWREAEEIAAIADNLLLPASVTSWMRGHRKG